MDVVAADTPVGQGDPEHWEAGLNIGFQDNDYYGVFQCLGD